MTVAVSGLQAGSSPAPGLEVAWCLAEVEGVRVVGIDYDPLCTGLYAGDPPLSRAVVIPSPVRWDDFLTAFRRVCEEESVEAFLPCTDLDVLLLAPHADELAAMGVKTLLPSLEALARIQKPVLLRGADAEPFTLPQGWVLHSEEDLGLLDSLTYPLCLKGRYSGVYPAREPVAARVYARKLASVAGWPVVVQEWVEGEEYSVLALAGRNQEILGGAVMKKIGLTEDGITWAGITVEGVGIRTAATQLVRTWNWQGPIDLDVMRTATGELVLLDVNARFSSWIKAACTTGTNLPRRLHEYVEDRLTKEGMEDWCPSGIAFAQYIDDTATTASAMMSIEMENANGSVGFYRDL